MFRRFTVIIQNLDWLLITAIFLLICFGLTSLYSLGLSQEESNFNLFTKQVVFAGFGFIILLAVSFLDYRWWKFLSGWLYLVALFLLVLVLFFGQNLRGTTGWFILGSVS